MLIYVVVCVMLAFVRLMKVSILILMLFYNDVIREYQQVQSSHGNDEREDEILSGDETSVCD